ncbi:MAG: ferrous iron transport protein A [Deltaproteobacteria bacterium]|nr:ferrous iron transport protein A [Deltaproteobacteria bacterium]
MTLSELVPGKICVITKLRAQDRLAQRLLDLGIFPGARLTVLRNAPLEDPMEVVVEGLMLSLRHDEAKFVEVEAR